MSKAHVFLLRCDLGAPRRARRCREVLPSPLWGGVGGGGRADVAPRCLTARPPTPTLPPKGGGGPPWLCHSLSQRPWGQVFRRRLPEKAPARADLPAPP